MNSGTRINDSLGKVLDGIAGFSAARVVSQLSDGPVNASYLLTQGGEKYVLRLDKPTVSELGLDRAAEHRVCLQVAAAGLGPEPVYFDPAAGVYLRRYLPGRSWEASDLDDSERLEALAGILRAVHQLPRAGAAFDPLQAASRYSERLADEGSRALLADATSLWRRIDEDSPLPVLCHNDLVCHNVLESDRLVLIDWEFSGIGNPYFDLAVVVEHHGLQEQLARHFLEAYLGRAANERETCQLDLNCRFYARLLELWERLWAGDSS
jgi:thiamine kinase-like enzyme